MDYYILKDKEVLPSDINGFSEQMESSCSRVIALEDVGEATVSTVFLGIDHNFDSDSSMPILFETMIFVEKHNERPKFHAFQWRYATYEEAEEGHKKVVEGLQQGLDLNTILPESRTD